MSVPLPERLASAFLELAELWQQERSKFTVTEVPGARGVKVTHPAMSRDWAARSPAHRNLALADIEDFEAAEVISMDWGVSENGRRGDFRLTPSGERVAARLRTPPEPALTPIESDWATNIRPVLDAAYAVEMRLTPDGGITQDALNSQLGRPPGDDATASALEQLSAAGYFRDEQSVAQIAGPIRFRLGERALQQVAGWPGAGNDIAAALLRAIDDRIADPDTGEDERRRLVRLRETAADVGKGVLAGVLTTLVKSQAGI